MTDDDRIDELEQRVEQLEQAVFTDSGPEYNSSQKKRSLAEFMKDYDTSSHNKRVLVVGYYLEKIEGRKNFTSEDIEEYYRRAKIKPPQTMGVPLSKNAKKGYVMEDGETDTYKLWVLTLDGEERVENELREDRDDE